MVIIGTVAAYITGNTLQKSAETKAAEGAK